MGLDEDRESVLGELAEEIAEEGKLGLADLARGRRLDAAEGALDDLAWMPGEELLQLERIGVSPEDALDLTHERLPFPRPPNLSVIA